jgi:hypothetical protein
VWSASLAATSAVGATAGPTAPSPATRGILASDPPRPTVGVPDTPAPGDTTPPTALPIVEQRDPRSEGSGPGIVGSPLAILAGVIVVGLLSAALTVVAARLTRAG